jgi:hypothetical protein
MYLFVYVCLCAADITINQTLMDELTEEEKQEFVASNPHTSERNVFAYDPATRKVGPALGQNKFFDLFLKSYFMS